MKYTHQFLFFLFCCISCTCFAQQEFSTQVKVFSELNEKKDTLLLTVNKDISLKAGSLMLTATSSASAKSDTFFFPILDSSNLFGILIPAEFRKGSLKLEGFFYPKIFEVSGKITEKTKSTAINALLITASQKIYNKQINLTPEKQFSLPPLVFENKGTLIFNYLDKKGKDHPDISLQQTPTPSSFKDKVYSESIQWPRDSIKNTAGKVVYIDSSAEKINDPKHTLKTVTVKATKKSIAEKFNEENSNALFKDATEKVIDCLSNDHILSFPDCLTYIQSQVAGITVKPDKFGASALFWRGHEINALYIDEIEVDAEQLLGLNVGDIAIIKAYPPPFFGATGGSGSGGGIAVYTRRGEYRRDDSTLNKWLFTIKGYSAAVHTLQF